ncbi:MAG: cytidylate kinase-like family protein [Geobacteraceae bacterium]|nr:cytidylate kinase-like family protein [Geobacteraceae bacterium]
MLKHFTVAISRQKGSGGAFIGQEVAKHLGFKYMDREILCQAASMLHEDESILSEREERISNLWDKILQAFSVCTPETGYAPPPLRHINDEEIFETEAMVINKVATNCSSVIVGRGAFHILRNNPRVLTVFLHASQEFRANRIMNIYNIADIETALALLIQSDKQRRKFVQEHTGVEWTDACNYTLCINTEIIGFPEAAEIIMQTAKKMSQVQ